jgi:hypothetical protein
MKVLLSVPAIFLEACTLWAPVLSRAQELKAPAVASATSPAQAEAVAVTPPHIDPGDRSKVVYVADFDVDLAGKDGKSTPVTGNSAAGQAAEGAQAVGKQETPEERASHFVDFVSAALVKELEKEGYVARRLRAGDSRPDEGLKISGVFAEPDEENRLRRAVVGGGPSVGQMALFVSIGNLARPEQPLYAVVDAKTASDNVGPVITVSAYAPVARFEMPKNVTEKAVHDTASSIVTDLTQLLHTNVAVLTR